MYSFVEFESLEAATSALQKISDITQEKAFPNIFQPTFSFHIKGDKSIQAISSRSDDDSEQGRPSAAGKHG
jgi:hypothetical protein